MVQQGGEPLRAVQRLLAEARAALLGADDEAKSSFFRGVDKPSGELRPAELREALGQLGLEPEPAHVDAVIEALGLPWAPDSVSVAELFGFLGARPAPLSMEQRIASAVAVAEAVEQRPTAARRKKTATAGLGRERERQADLDLARSTARALALQTSRFAPPVPKPAPAPQHPPVMPYTPGDSPADLQKALQIAAERVEQQRLEIEQLAAQAEGAAAEEARAAEQAQEVAAEAKREAAAVADAALAKAESDAAADVATPMQMELERLRSQRRERNKKQAAAARRRRDAFGLAVAHQPLDCGQKAVPDKARLAEQRDARHIMQGKGSRRFRECRSWVRALGLKSLLEWLQFSSSGARPAHIPADPDRVFRTEGWVSYDNWLLAPPEEQPEMVEQEEDKSVIVEPPLPPGQSSISVQGIPRRRFQLGEMVQVRNSADSWGRPGYAPLQPGQAPPTPAWGIGFVTQLDPLQANMSDADPSEKGYTWDEVRPFDEGPAMQPPPEPLAEFGHEDADGWRGWIEARRSGHTQTAEIVLLPLARLKPSACGLCRFASTLGLSRDFLQHLDDSKVAAILHLSPNLARFLSEENPLQPELVDVLRHTPERALARAYRKWARTPSRPADIPERCAKARSLCLCVQENVGGGRSRGD